MRTTARSKTDSLSSPRLHGGGDAAVVDAAVAGHFQVQPGGEAAHPVVGGAQSVITRPSKPIPRGGFG